ncbi:MAG TPA: hypothetical protein VFX03_05755, partial [Thermomicrobiales bacterium]|nr:hypothetical protein [Thermomicrobiales bacterium]
SQISEVAISYRDGPLAGPACGEGGAKRLPWPPRLGALEPGDRAPQGVGRAFPTDAPATLFDRYAWGGFTLVLFPDDRRVAGLADAVAFGQTAAATYAGLLRSTIVVRAAPPFVAPGADLLLDADGEIHRLYDAASHAWLVRPDGYLACCLQIGDDAALAAYLDRIVAPAD